MDRALSGFRWMLRLIGYAELFLASAILVGIVATILIQVLLNAGLGSPITWEQEGGAYALVWLTFLGASIGLKQMRHVKIVSFVGGLPGRLRCAIRAAVYCVIICTLLVLMRELGPIMEIESRSTTIALPVDLPRSYFFSVPLLAASTLMLATSVLYFAEAAAGVIQGERSSGPETSWRVLDYSQ